MSDHAGMIEPLREALNAKTPHPTSIGTDALTDGLLSLAVCERR
jgi:hypothetical protein